MTRRRSPRSRVLIRAAAVALGGLLPLLVAAPALAQAAVPQHEVGGVAAWGAWDWISLSIRIGAILVVIWASVVAMRWYVRRMNGEANGGMTRAMQIVETRVLGPNRALHLVRIGDRAVLIGATPERINALMEIDQPDQLEQIFAGRPDSTPRPGTALFAGLASLPGIVSGMRASMSGRAGVAALSQEDVFLATGEPGVTPAAASAASTRRVTSPAGFLTGALTRLGRRMHAAGRRARQPRPSMPALAPATPPAHVTSAPPAVTPFFDAMTEVPPAIAALQHALEARIAPKARNASLFERTLAEAHRAQGVVTEMPAMPSAPMFAAPAAPPSGGLAASAAAMRARTGYAQAAAEPSAADLEREERINDLQRAIAAARRQAG